jgi:hypothetical protein
LIKWLIPEAANGKPILLEVVVVPEHIATVEVQVAGPGVVAVEVVLSSTPEESNVPNKVETTNEIAITTWDSGKTT